jgi:hypothetical protein
VEIDPVARLELVTADVDGRHVPDGVVGDVVGDVVVLVLVLILVQGRARPAARHGGEHDRRGGSKERCRKDARQPQSRAIHFSPWLR